MEERLFENAFSLDKVIDLKAIASIYIFNFTPNYQMNFEHHSTIELIYVDVGEEEVFENDKSYIVRKGEMFLHRPHAVHKDRCISPTSTCYIVSFEADEKGFESLFDRVITLTKKEITQLKEFFELFLNNVTCPIEKIVPERATTVKNNTFGISQIIKNKFELFFLSILNSAKGEFSNLKNYDGPLVKSIIDELYKLRLEKFSLAKIANTLSYSKSYLCRHFKNETGTTIIYHFYAIKINESKKMLMSGEYTIEEVSDLLGFDSVQYFSKVFKKYVGLTPSNWKSISSERMYF